jgi:hypothetical protein
VVRTNNVGYVNSYDNFDKIVVRYIHGDYVIVAPATNAKEAAAILKFEYDRGLEN